MNIIGLVPIGLVMPGVIAGGMVVLLMCSGVAKLYRWSIS